jgi:hypothetical protein
MAATLPARTPRAVPREMSKADICNVEPLTADDFEALGFEDGAGLDIDTLDALGWGESWTLATEGSSCR